MLPGRLGLEGGRIPQKDRHGVIWLARGQISVEAGTLKFITAGDDVLAAGSYAIPYQTVSCIVMQPGTSITHDALRILARHGTGLVVSGTAGVRFYASMPAAPDSSKRARRQVKLWADPKMRLMVARRMYAIRLGELFPDASLDVLRGMEGARVKATYKAVAEQYGLTWRGRRYDRQNPERTDPINEAINHVSIAMNSAASIAVAITGCIPQLGFVHEDSGNSFSLDIADMFRHDVTVPVACQAVQKRKPHEKLERVARKQIADHMRRKGVIAKMIDRIKNIIDDAGDDDNHP